MTDQERQEFIRVLKNFQKKISKKSEARKFLVKAGIYTEKGNLTKNYKHLCIPQDQG